MSDLRWGRVVGDSVFAIGALVLGWFVLGLVTGHSYDRPAQQEEDEVGAPELQPQEMSAD